jgi:hypothetical protein
MEAYTAEVTTMAMQTAARFEGMIDPDRMIAGTLSLAVHLGTYEAIVAVVPTLVAGSHGSLGRCHCLDTTVRRTDEKTL